MERAAAGTGSSVGAGSSPADPSDSSAGATVSATTGCGAGARNDSSSLSPRSTTDAKKGRAPPPEPEAVVSGNGGGVRTRTGPWVWYEQEASVKSYADWPIALCDERVDSQPSPRLGRCALPPSCLRRTCAATMAAHGELRIGERSGIEVPAPRIPEKPAEESAMRERRSAACSSLVRRWVHLSSFCTTTVLTTVLALASFASDPVAEDREEDVVAQPIFERRADGGKSRRVRSGRLDSNASSS